MKTLMIKAPEVNFTETSAREQAYVKTRKQAKMAELANKASDQSTVWAKFKAWCAEEV